MNVSWVSRIDDCPFTRPLRLPNGARLCDQCTGTQFKFYYIAAPTESPPVRLLSCSTLEALFLLAIVS